MLFGILSSTIKYLPKENYQDDKRKNNTIYATASVVRSAYSYSDIARKYFIICLSGFNYNCHFVATKKNKFKVIKEYKKRNQANRWCFYTL